MVLNVFINPCVSLDDDHRALENQKDTRGPRQTPLVIGCLSFECKFEGAKIKLFQVHQQPIIRDEFMDFQRTSIRLLIV